MRSFVRRTAWSLVIGFVLLLVLVMGARLYYAVIVNPRVIAEISENPAGERAGRVTLITLGSGRQMPVNYLREGNQVFLGADGRWWQEFEGAGAPVTLLIRGEALRGNARVILDDPAYTRDVFSRLRPAAPGWLPAALNAKLIVVTLEGAG